MGGLGDVGSLSAIDPRKVQVVLVTEAVFSLRPGDHVRPGGEAVDQAGADGQDVC